MKTAFSTVVGLFLTLTLTAPAFGGTMAGVTMADSLAVGNSTLRLAGMGIRTKFIIRVYVAGLYYAGSHPDQEAIIGSDKAKAVRMHFLYNKVEAAKLQDAWREGFEKNTPDAPDDLRERMEAFIGLFTQDAAKGDEYLFVYDPGVGTRVILKGQEAGLIRGGDFAGALMAVWFGDHPADKGLKNSVLKGMGGKTPS